MADWTFGVGRSSAAGKAEGSSLDRKAAEAWVEAWSARFRDWWQSTNMSQSELAKRLGVSPMTVSRWTRGKARPTADAAVRLEEMVAQVPVKSKAADPSMTERLLGLLEDLPHGKRIGHLFESIGKVFEQAISQVAGSMGGGAAPAATAAAPEPEVKAPAAAVKKRGRKPAKTSAPPPAPKSVAAATAPKPVTPAPALVTTPRNGGSKKRAEAPAKKTRGAAAVKVVEEAPKQVPAAAAAKGGGKRGRPAKPAKLTWPELIQAIQKSEGWGEGRNRKLADTLKVAPSTISNWLGGHRTPRGGPRDMLAAMARKHGLGVPA